MGPEHWTYAIPLRLRSLFRWIQADQELDDELRDHLERKTEEYVARGMAPEEARRRARLALGGMEKVKEECRDARGVNWIQDFIRDLHFGLRRLRKSPGFTAVAILTLALSSGVNTTIFTALDATAFRPLPVRDPDQIVRVVRWIPQGYGGTLFSFPEYAYYRNHNDVFSGLAGDSCCYDVVYGGQPATDAVTVPKSALLSARLVSENYFEVLGLNAVLGRFFLPEEGQSEESNPVAVLSYQFWQQRLNSDPNILGKSLILNAAHFTVVGIVPRDFIGSGDPPAVPDVWIPLAMQPYIVPGSLWMDDARAHNVRMVGRLKPGMALKKAQSALTVLAQQLAHTPIAKDQTAITTHLTVKRASFLDFGGTGSDFAVSVTLALAAAGMVLLVACANVANLLLTRAIARRKEFGVRLVLGAGRRRVVRQLLTESALIALLGGMVGLVLSTWACHVLWFSVQHSLQKFYPPDLLLRVDPDVRVFGYTLFLSLATTFAFGLAPALQASKTDLTSALKQDAGAVPRKGRSLLRFSLRDTLVLAQVSLSLLLLVAVGLLARGLERSQTIDPGFETKNLMAVDLDFPALGYGYGSPMVLSLRQEIAERLDALPQIKSACFASEGWTSVSPESARSLPFVPYTVISPDYFRTLGIQIVRGRDFHKAVQSGAPTVIVSNATARLLWPGEDPIGKRLNASDRSSSYAEVIGVVSDVRSARLSEVDFAHLYFPITPSDQSLVLWVRTRNNPENTLGSIRDALGTLDKGLLLAPTRTVNDLLWLQRLPAVISTAMAAILGALALMLAAVGIYGVMAYVVSQRTHEIGVRIALGSNRADALALVLKQGMRPVVLGIILGFVGAVALSHVMSFLLFGVSPLDPVAFSCASAFLIVVAALAAYVPSRRATEVDPMVALRYE